VGLLMCMCHLKASPPSRHISCIIRCLRQDTECHQIIVEDWANMEDPHGTIFVSIPSLLDPSVAPDGCHVMHVFTPDWVNNWTVCNRPCF
jgi:prolycopene isomerase